ncbi:hypothetical protein CQW23_04199 [Capsicum baccatum]|uniref:Transposase-associated domain-containing protein n=1 Tax=Capsicum baccatum TaxID=33114 RepID=A0A2G2XDY9_CAPBA|nr:hypothetical protein CQW23_04199 [Capsicum baccatum]
MVPGTLKTIHAFSTLSFLTLMINPDSRNSRPIPVPVDFVRVHDMNNSDRERMYDRLLEDGFINPRFIDGVESFVEFAKIHPECMDGEKLRSPCNKNHRKCRNKIILDEFTLMIHLGNNGFVPNYYRWNHRGESYIPGPSVFGNHQEEALASGGRGGREKKDEDEDGDRDKDEDEDENEDEDEDGDEDADDDKDDDDNDDDNDDHDDDNEEEEECELHKKKRRRI